MSKYLCQRGIAFITFPGFKVSNSFGFSKSFAVSIISVHSRPETLQELSPGSVLGDGAWIFQTTSAGPGTTFE